jgi:hypothetical protein
MYRVVTGAAVDRPGQTGPPRLELLAARLRPVCLVRAGCGQLAEAKGVAGLCARDMQASQVQPFGPGPQAEASAARRRPKPPCAWGSELYNSSMDAPMRSQL